MLNWSQIWRALLKTMLGRLYGFVSTLFHDTVWFVVSALVSYRGLVVFQTATACVTWVWLLENTSSLAMS